MGGRDREKERKKEREIKRERERVDERKKEGTRSKWILFCEYMEVMTVDKVRRRVGGE